MRRPRADYRRADTQKNIDLNSIFITFYQTIETKIELLKNMPLPAFITEPPSKEELNRPFAWVLCKLQKSRGFKGQELAEMVGLTVESVSKLRQAKARPRAATFELLLEKLCESDSERRLFERAYHKPRSINLTFDEPPTDKVERAGQKQALVEMATRTQPLRHKKKIQKVLEKLSIDFERDYIIGDSAADFILTLHFEYFDDELGFEVPIQREFALLCDLNPDARFDPAMASFIRSSLLVEEVIWVVPHIEGTPHTFTPQRERKVQEKRWRDVFEALKKQKLEESELERKRNTLFKKWPRFNDILTPKTLQPYLEELKSFSVPPPRTITREEQELPERVRAALARRKIPLETKEDGTKCARRTDTKLIGILYAADLNTALHREVEAAVTLREKSGLHNVVVVIPETDGIGLMEMQSGIRIVPIDALSGDTLGLRT